jgi:hypothetical protein
MANVRSIYLEWCKLYDKEIDEFRFQTFKSNFLMMESHAMEHGKTLELSQWYDCTEQECKEQISEHLKQKEQQHQCEDGLSSSLLPPPSYSLNTPMPMPVPIPLAEQSMAANAEVFESPSLSKQILYKCSNEDYNEITKGKAILKVIKNIETVLDADYTDLTHLEEARAGTSSRGDEFDKQSPSWDEPGSWKRRP